MFTELLAETAILGAAAWRLMSLLVYEEGPFRIFERLRDWTNSLGGLLDCPWCTSVWAAALLLIIAELIPGGRLISAWLAISTVAVMMDAVIPSGEEQDG